MDTVLDSWRRADSVGARLAFLSPDVSPDQSVDLYDDWLTLLPDAYSDRKRSIAFGLRCWMDWRREHCDGALDAAGDRHIVRRSVATLQLAMRSAGADIRAHRHLQILSECCDRLLSDIRRVRNFDRPALYPLVELSHNVGEGHLARWIELVSRAVGEAGAVSSAVPGSSMRADPELLLCASVVRAITSRAADDFHELLGFCAEMWRVLALLAYRTDRSRTHRQALAKATQAVRLARAEPFASDKMAWGAFAFHRCVALFELTLTDRPGRDRRRAAQLLESTAAYAAAQHGDACLAGKALSSWFADSTFSGLECLQALERSPWVDTDYVDRSRFFAHLAGPRGPMHGVFSPEELTLLKRGLIDTGPAAARAPEVDDYLRYSSGHRASAGEARPPCVHGNHRDHFYILLNPDSQPFASQMAQALVQSVLDEVARHQAAMEADPVFSRFSYAPASFRRRVDDVYLHQSAQTSALNLEFSDEELRAVHLAFAPFALVDGCWLAKAGSARHDLPVGRILNAIFADETGNGCHRRNHATLYRELLVQLGFDLPAVWQKDFAQDRRVPSLAFKAPAFLLALDLAFHRHMPELLGVNLAIEMTGLDGFYGAMSHGLELRGIDSAFWRVHISVDNLATGHARQSALAIEHFLDAIGRGLGTQCQQSTWERIWNGFLAMVYLFRIEMSVLLSSARMTQTSHISKDTTEGTA
jgi:hypothetical protein